MMVTRCVFFSLLTVKYFGPDMQQTAYLLGPYSIYSISIAHLF